MCFEWPLTLEHIKNMTQIMYEVYERLHVYWYNVKLKAVINAKSWIMSLNQEMNWFKSFHDNI